MSSEPLPLQVAHCRDFGNRGWTAALALMAVVLAYWGAGRIGALNRMDPWHGDAAAYRDISSQFAGSILPCGTDGVRNELCVFGEALDFIAARLMR